NHILNIVTLNSAAYQELNHDNSKIYIKVLIKKYGKMYPLSGFSDIKDLKIFTQKYNNTIKNNENFTAKKPYIELSLGKFENKFENKILAKKFEEIRQMIRNG
ncbi:hypothetical protein ELL26_03515, partial [Campylobacter coli]|nr:hypothetical protein [Campylobacter coli]